LKICIISKYPPIEGGVSARVYWLAKALGERGHEVHVVTNAQEVENEYREIIDENDPEFIPKNVHVHSIDADTNLWHIPFSQAYAERLANLAIEVIHEYDIQLIDSCYILPYAISGFIAKNVTGRPMILRHAGSDIGKLYSSTAYQTLFKSIFKKADRVVTIPQLKQVFLDAGVHESNVLFENLVGVDTNAFQYDVIPFFLSEYVSEKIPSCPIITYIGKVDYYWKYKGLSELIESVHNIKADFRLFFVANGKGLADFKRQVKNNNLEDKSIFLNFIPPWKIPSIIKLSTCVVVPEREFPVPYHMPILPREVMAVGKCLILSRELYDKQCYGDLIDGENVLIVDPKNAKQFRTSIEKIVNDPDIALRIGQNSYKHSQQMERFDEYIDFKIRQYESVI